MKKDFYIWTALLFANLVLVYTIFNHANKTNINTDLFTIAETNAQTETTAVSPNPATAIPKEKPAATEAPAPTPAGPIINIAFSIPGIGSGSANMTHLQSGGNMNPKHLKRNVRVLLYAPDANSSLSSIKPLHSINGSAVFDATESSSTYTSFVNENFYLGKEVKEGDYQIVLQAEKGLTKLIKEKEDSINGKIFTFNKGRSAKRTPHQTITIGDIAPPTEGNNVMDIKDYNLLVSCTSPKEDAKDCTDQQIADLNDDGTVDGIDYNLMLLSFKVLKSLGFPVPTIATTPTPWIVTPGARKKTAVPTIVPKTQTKAKTSGGGVGLVLLILLLIVSGIVSAAGVILYKQNDRFKDFVQKFIPAALLHHGKINSQTTAPAVTPASQSSPQAPGQSQATSQMPTPTLPANDQSVEGEYYIKKQSTDEKNNGLWLSLVGDNGSTTGFYHGKEITEGFAKIKGVTKKDGEKTYIDIAEITQEK